MLVCSQLHRVVPPKFRNVSAAHQEVAYRGENAVASSVVIHSNFARLESILSVREDLDRSARIASFSPALNSVNNNSVALSSRRSVYLHER